MMSRIMSPLLRKRFLALLAFPLLWAGSVYCRAFPEANERPRLVVLTDIGGDPDDQQSMIRLLAYANEFELEALIASASGTPGELKQEVTRPDLILELIAAYGVVLPRLRTHADGWPSVERLNSIVCSGNPKRGKPQVGVGNDTAGSNRLVELLLASSPERPLDISIWGGQTDLAQALFQIKRRFSESEWKKVTRSFRVFDIADQDGIADWMRTEYPSMQYIMSGSPRGRDRREATFRGMYLTGDESLTSRAWVEEHVRTCGPLGALYPIKTWTAPNPHGCLKEGTLHHGSSFFREEATTPTIQASQDGVGSISKVLEVGSMIAKKSKDRTDVKKSAGGDPIFKRTLPSECSG